VGVSGGSERVFSHCQPEPRNFVTYSITQQRSPPGTDWTSGSLTADASRSRRIFSELNSLRVYGENDSPTRV
jgi:hypothetical protein